MDSESKTLRLLVIFHLLATGVLALLALLLSMRFPYPEARGSFHRTMGMLVVCALAIIPLAVAGDLRLLWIALAAFIAATLSFLFFAVRVIRAHYDRLKR